jgi:hypothetical protein
LLPEIAPEIRKSGNLSRREAVAVTADAWDAALSALRNHAGDLGAWLAISSPTAASVGRPPR